MKHPALIKMALGASLPRYVELRNQISEQFYQINVETDKIGKLQRDANVIMIELSRIVKRKRSKEA